ALRRTGGNPVAPDIDVGPGNVADLAAKGFKLLPYEGPVSTAISAMPAFARPFIKRILADRPIFHPDLCIGCSACFKICPAAALELDKNRQGQHQIRIDDAACITCFCCHEICPAHAISIGRVLSRKPWEKKHL
ncbi:MAG: 4Fe-4S dicluster domain-containing protein, partial [Spirochaetales bacterium]